jgi:hypothetical protein
LSGRVEPENATNQDILWTVQDAGETGALIEEDTLTAPVEGTITVRATIVDGLGDRKKLYQRFHD